MICAKEFKPVTSCCNKNCFRTIEAEKQQGYYNAFWVSARNYHSQNIFLAGLLTRKPMSKIENQVVLWEYFFRFDTINVSVCQAFLCAVLNIKKGRISTIQQKLKNNEPLIDKRGMKRKIVLTEELKKMIEEHCLSIPHSDSHYRREKSSLKYFDHPDLTLNKLYELFCEYYTAKTGDSNRPLEMSTYTKYFNNNLNFSFSNPRTDVCNLCYEHRNDKTVTTEIENHKKSIESYKILKKNMLSEKDVLCLEFDFGQNLPLPKIPVSDQFYKRLLWLHIFNVNVFGDHKRSYMYLFMEGILKKGANTVCNLLFHSIQNELKLNYYNKIYLFSDACGGQNKNYLILCFLSLLSRKLELEITHVYPVRGHSYCSCDRNFGMYGQKKKKKETIETVDDYCELIQNARNPPFTIIRESEIVVKNFELLIPKKFKIPNNLQISKPVTVKYFPNGQVELFNTYDGLPNEYFLRSTIVFDDLLQSETAPSIGVNKEKINDVNSLVKYLSSTGKDFLNSFIQSSSVKSKKESVKKENIVKNDKTVKDKKTELTVNNKDKKTELKVDNKVIKKKRNPKK